MKIKKLSIKNWHQFQDFELDFTYPEGHKLAGQPLQKVCFIGPNGVGKSKILKVVREFVSGTVKFSVDLVKKEDIDKFEVESESGIIFNDENSNIIKTNSKSIFIENITTSSLDTKLGANDFNDYHGIKGNLEVLNNRISKHLFYQNKHFIFEIREVYELTRLIILLQTKLILEYASIRSLGIAGDDAESRIEYLGKIFNEILSVFAPKIKWTGFNPDLRTLSFRVESENKIVSIDELSSGIKDMVMKFFVLKHINPTDTIIFVDEPENSLFPDIQKRLVEMYTSVGEDNQFFFATHSPLIASQFEPCEIFPLDFDDSGKVIVKNRPKAIEGWSSDEILQYWFGTQSRSEKYEQAVKRWYEISANKNPSEEQKKEIQEFINGTHPEFGTILKNSNFFG